MASLFRVPKKHFAGFENFLKLSSESADRIISSIKENKPTLDTKNIILDAVSSEGEIERNQVVPISAAIQSLLFAKATSDSSTEEFVSELLQAIEESPEVSSLLISIEKDSIKTRLENLLNITPLSISAKARSVMYEYDNVYYRSRLITDIRPVFDTSLEDINAALIIHNLRIHYHEGETHKDFFVAMDNEDIQQLINVLERAKKKALRIKEMLGKTEVLTFESVEE